MITEQLLKSNFSGKDGFSWWIGRVAHPDYWKNQNLAMGNLGSSSHRVKVRIIGYHPWDDTLKESDLPWAHVAMDAVTGSGQGSLGDTLNLVGGETAIGFFLDGEEAQQPVIIGLLHRSAEVQPSISEQEIKISGSNQFKPFTGFAGGKIGATKREQIKYEKIKIEGNEATVTNPGKVENTNNNEASINLRKGEASLAEQAFERDTTKEHDNPSLCGDGVIDKISQILTDFVGFTAGLEKFKEDFIDPITNQIVDMAQRIREVAKQIQRIFKKVINNIRTGIIKRVMSLFKIFAGLNKKVNPLDFFLGPAAHKAFKKIIKILFCVFDNIFGDLFGFIENMLKNIVGKIINTPLCAVEQFVSGILKKGMGLIEKGLSPILSGINWLTGGLGNISKVLSQASNFARKILRFLECTGVKCDKPSKWISSMNASIEGKVDRWQSQIEKTDFLGGVQKSLAEVEKNLGREKLARWIAGEDLDEAKKTIINGSNAYDLIKMFDKITGGKATELFEAGGFGSVEAAIASYSIFGNGSSTFDECTNKIYNPTNQEDLSRLPIGINHPQCIPPVAQIRGVGTGAVIKPIVGNDRSIFSIEILNGGSGYDSSTGVAIIDNGGNGTGAQAQVIVKDGSINQIVMLSGGEGYCLGGNNSVGGDITVGTGITVGVGTDVSGIVTSVFIDRPGLGYTSGDTFTVGSGLTTGNLTITPNGSIIDAELPTNFKLELDSRPIITLNTKTGVGGRILPIMKFNTQFVVDKDGLSGVRPLIGITSVIDCPPKEHFSNPNQVTPTQTSTQTQTPTSTPAPTQTQTQTSTPAQTESQTSPQTETDTGGGMTTGY